MKIEIKESEVLNEEIRPGKKPGAKQFDPFTKYYQIAYAYLVAPNGRPDAVPTKFEIRMNKDSKPHPVGFYTLQDESIFVDRNHNLTMGYIVIRAVGPVAAAKAA